jgi:C4-dicarboxylate-specific signal transduction histidine kinase
MMAITQGNAVAAAECESRQLVSDLFHQLSQPLTTLCCSLELALLQTPTAEQYSEIVSQALSQAEKVSALATAIRELFDASLAGQCGEVLDLRRAVEETVGDLLPVAESAGVRVCYLPGPSCRVWFDAPRLRQGLFHLIGFAIGSDGPGAAVRIELAEHGAELGMGLTISGSQGICDEPSNPNPDLELLRRLGLGIARAVFEAAGGSLSVNRGVERLTVEVRALRDEPT